MRLISKISNKKARLALAISVSIALFSALLAVATYYHYYYNRFLPNTYIAGIYVGNKTVTQAKSSLASSVVSPKVLQIMTNTDSSSFEIPLTAINFSYDFDATINNASKFALNTSVVSGIQALLQPNSKIVMPLMFNLDEETLNKHVDTIISQIVVDPVYPSVKLENKQVIVQKGSNGKTADKQLLVNQIKENLSVANIQTLFISTKFIDPTLTDEQAENYKQEAARYIGESIDLVSQDYTHIITDAQIIELLEEDNTWNEEKLATIIDEVKRNVNREPQDSVFVFENNKVKEFTPSKDGLEVKTEDLKSEILSKLNQLTTTEDLVAVNIPVIATQPKVSNSEVNDLGIKELIGRGTSTFKGSISSRVYNIALASSRINGSLIKPGETFSFNNALGDVSKLTGYKEAYVIKDGRTVLGDGGGVCQVSTTFFRAAMDAGLPIAERRGHSYRVGYYEQDAGPGLDATVYAPTTDLKVVNDTPGHILVQAIPDTKNLTLVFEFYGTSDGRVSQVTKPVILSSTAPPEDQYVDDPTLPTGQVKQIEHKAWGAKTSFNYTVTRNGEEIYKKSFVTNYRPWAAVFLRGTGPAI